jgi:glutamate N-acetyltransferase/amino-acid N-acetyltransferase
MAIVQDTLTAPLPEHLPAVARTPAVPDGFAVGGMPAGIKVSGRPDLALVAVTTPEPASAAAVFTPNPFAAAPVRLAQANLLSGDPSGGGRRGMARAIVCTSGSANAATGRQGDVDQAQIAAAVASSLSVDPTAVLTLSTGIIGIRLPVERVISGVRSLAPRLGAGGPDLEAAARAFMTTDSRPKLVSVVLELPSIDGSTRIVTVAGIAKGVGMIHPRMATMLAVVLTDAAVSPTVLADLLRAATARTWDQLSVDGDTSTNDTVFALASGAAGAANVGPGTPEAAALGAAIEAVARDLARQQAADGEGATTLITCQVSGGGDDAEARAVARAVISSSLVKAAVHGRDPNWGRIVAAAGNARLADTAVLVAGGLEGATAALRAGGPATVDPGTLRVAIAGHVVFDGPSGGPIGFDRTAARAAMDADEVLIRLDLGLGDGIGEAFGCDLTEAYVVENSEYTT